MKGRFTSLPFFFNFERAHPYFLHNREILEMADILVNITSVKDEKQSAKGGDSEEAHKKAKRKKRRARTSPDQLELLENIFKTDQMPDQQMRVRLADRLGMTPRRVQV